MSGRTPSAAVQQSEPGRARRLALVLAFLMATVVGLLPTPAVAAEPQISRASLQQDGTHTVSHLVLGQGAVPSGFGEVEFYWPSDVPASPRASVVVMPGYTNDVADVAWMATRLASHGYVVMLTRPPLTFDYPAARAATFKAAVAYFPTSPLGAMVDPGRMAIWGYSMGGGAALEAASQLPQLKAVVGAFPWNLRTQWPSITSPTLVMVGSEDPVAIPGWFGDRMYSSLTGTSQKAEISFTTNDHRLIQHPDPRTSEMTLAWLGRYLLDDPRYDQFLCPGPAVGAGTGYSSYHSGCTQ